MCIWVDVPVHIMYIVSNELELLDIERINSETRHIQQRSDSSEERRMQAMLSKSLLVFEERAIACLGLAVSLTSLLIAIWALTQGA